MTFEELRQYALTVTRNVIASCGGNPEAGIGPSQDDSFLHVTGAVDSLLLAVVLHPEALEEQAKRLRFLETPKKDDLLQDTLRLTRLSLGRDLTEGRSLAERDRVYVHEHEQELRAAWASASDEDKAQISEIDALNLVARDMGIDGA